MTFHITVPIGVPDSLLPFHPLGIHITVPAIVPGKTVEDDGHSASAPATHWGDQDGAPSSWLKGGLNTAKYVFVE